MAMRVRWNYKLLPNFSQDALMAEWLITLRKHKNYCLRERKEGWDTNNRDAEMSVSYAWGSYCELRTRQVWGACRPLTCPVVKHGVLSAELTKTAKGQLHWGNASDIQSKRTTQLRHESDWYSRIDSDVLQRNLARLDTAFVNFWRHGSGFPKFSTKAGFKSFEYKPRRCKFEVTPKPGKKHRYSRVYLPGIGWMRYFDSRPIPPKAQTRTVTIIRQADGWYMSVLLDLPWELPATTAIEEVNSLVGVDVGINKLLSLSDGSFVENPKPATNQRMKRRLKIRQRRVNRKQKGSNSRAKAGKRVAKLHKKISDKRNATQWKGAAKTVNTAEAVTHESLNIQGMKRRCTPNRKNGRFLPNGQSAKRGLNRAISDAAWGEIFQKIAWLALKAGKPVVQFYTPYSSQECPKCGHADKSNRDGEKFLCANCGHLDHADTKASRTGVSRTMQDYNLHFNPKSYPRTLGKVTPLSDSASNGKRDQDRNPISKAMPETGILEQPQILDLESLAG